MRLLSVPLLGAFCLDGGCVIGKSSVLLAGHLEQKISITLFLVNMYGSAKLIPFAIKWSGVVCSRIAAYSQCGQRYRSAFYSYNSMMQRSQPAVERVVASSLVSDSTFLQKLRWAASKNSIAFTQFQSQKADDEKISSNNSPRGNTSRRPFMSVSSTPVELVAGVEQQEQKCLALRQKLDLLVSNSAVVLFMKGTPQAPQCGFSARAVALLDALGFDEYTFINILQYPEVRETAKAHFNWPTFPLLIVGKQVVGGVDIMEELHKTGELKKIVTNSLQKYEERIAKA